MPKTEPGKRATMLPTHITLAEGQTEGEIPTTRLGRPSSLFLLRDKMFPVVPDDSREEGVGETLALSLIESGRCCAARPTKEEKAALVEETAALAEAAVSPAAPALPVATGAAAASPAEKPAK